MRGLSIVFFVFCTSFLISNGAEDVNHNGVYIVYMGAASSVKGSLRADHAQLINSVLKRDKDAVLHVYKHGFSGFAARLTAEEATAIAQKPGVVYVFPSKTLQLHTTRSWDFLENQNGGVIGKYPNLETDSSDGGDVIIGLLDSGITPESESFNDKDMGPIPAKWKGTCMKGDDPKFSCNKKVIGNRFYNQDDQHKVDLTLSPRDEAGHGTHTSSTAAGILVQNVSYYGLAQGMARGGAPKARIAMYKVCDYGCSEAAIMAGFDDAIGDGVDILSLSLGSYFPDDLKTPDSIIIGSFHATEKGILVICSAGNSGPGNGTVSNYAPWIFSVAASTFDRSFQSNVVIGGGKVFTGSAINFSPLNKTAVHPLTHGLLAKKLNSDENAARECELEALDKSMIEGKIVVCKKEKDFSMATLLANMKELGAIGVVTGCDVFGSLPPETLAYPATVVSLKDEAQIFSYINSTRKPVGTVLATKIVLPYKPAPVIADFSSRGPGLLRNIIKPDITAPGVNVLAAWRTNDSSISLPGKEPPSYYIISGTSMSCPHVSGLAAVVKQRHPSWSSSAIRSAIMTTTIYSCNDNTPIRTYEGRTATAYDMGAGEINPTAALDPGLVYETSTVDYLNLMCYDGFTIKQIKQIATELPAGFSCPKENQDQISNINYPSIAITKFSGSRTVTRTVTNVAEDDDKSPYKVQVESSDGLEVKIVPNELQFEKNGQKLSYKVTFSATGSSLSKDVFGSITWSNNKHKVRIPFMVSTNNGDGKTEA